MLRFPLHVYIGDPFTSKSSGSEVSSGPFIEKSDLDSLGSEVNDAPFARHGPILEADPENVDMQRGFWRHCAFGFILDYRKFSIAYLQQLINSAWRLKGVATVVGRDLFFYLIHFEKSEHLEDMCAEGLWVVDGALLVLEKLRPNLVVNSLHLNYVSIWVQLHGLPLEYQYPELAEQMVQLIGFVERVDCDDHIPRNIRFLQVRVSLDPWMPLISGFILRLDDGSRTWIQCRYERVHKLCTRCGLIGHTRRQCNESMDEVERCLIRQRQRLQRIFHVQYGFDAMEPHFHNELRAFYNKRRHWTTQVRGGNMQPNNHDHIHHPDPNPIHQSHSGGNNMQSNNHSHIHHPEPNPNQSPPTVCPLSHGMNTQVFSDPDTPSNYYDVNTHAPLNPATGQHQLTNHANLYSAIFTLNLGNTSDTHTPVNSPTSSTDNTPIHPTNTMDLNLVPEEASQGSLNEEATPSYPLRRTW